MFRMIWVLFGIYLIIFYFYFSIMSCKIFSLLSHRKGNYFSASTINIVIMQFLEFDSCGFSSYSPTDKN